MEQLNRQQLIELVERIRNAEGKTEKEQDDLITLFVESVPDPDAANYIFSLEYDWLSSEEIVDRALAYKPFIL